MRDVRNPSKSCGPFPEVGLRNASLLFHDKSRLRLVHDHNEDARRNGKNRRTGVQTLSNFSKEPGMTNDRNRSRYVKIALLYYVIWVAVFVLEGLYAATLPAADLTSWVDRQIPVVPGFVWIYMSCYLFPLLTLLVVRDWHRLNLALLSITLCTILAFTGHLGMPVAFPRPPLGSSISAQMLAFIYEHDFKPGAQNFPSLHVAIALIIYFACRRQGLRRLAEWTILAMAVLISVSTILIKQHLVIDLVGGSILAIAVWGSLALVYRRLVPPEKEPLDALTALARKLAPLYALCTLCLATVGVARAIL